MLLATFRAGYPEFNGASDIFVQEYLDRAAKHLSSQVCGNLYDEAHGALAAHKMALSPFGQNAKLSGEGVSTYYIHYLQVIRTVTSGYRVI